MIYKKVPVWQEVTTALAHSTIYDEFVTGDGGIYSTIGDLYLFDRALYGEGLLSKAERTQAFTPARVRVGTTTYGFGWNIDETVPGKRIWHTGSTGGFRAYFERRLEGQNVVIMLTNVGDSRRVEISAAINHIRRGEPFNYPKRSSAVALHKVLIASGINAMLAAYREFKANTQGEYDLSESELNMLGYQILYPDGKPLDAIKVFTLNAKEYVASSNAFDSLAEAYNVGGDKPSAKRNYKRALELDPDNVHAKTALTQLK